jgi:hypothetical protein
MGTRLVELTGNDPRVRALCQLEDWRMSAYSGERARNA